MYKISHLVADMSAVIIEQMGFFSLQELTNKLFLMFLSWVNWERWLGKILSMEKKSELKA